MLIPTPDGCACSVGKRWDSSLLQPISVAHDPASAAVDASASPPFTHTVLAISPRRVIGRPLQPGDQLRRYPAEHDSGGYTAQKPQSCCRPSGAYSKVLNGANQSASRDHVATTTPSGPAATAVMKALGAGTLAQAANRCRRLRPRYGCLCKRRPSASETHSPPMSQETVWQRHEPVHRAGSELQTLHLRPGTSIIGSKHTHRVVIAWARDRLRPRIARPVPQHSTGSWRGQPPLRLGASCCLRPPST